MKISSPKHKVIVITLCLAQYIITHPLWKSRKKMHPMRNQKMYTYPSLQLHSGQALHGHKLHYFYLYQIRPLSVKENILEEHRAFTLPLFIPLNGHLLPIL